MEVAIDLLHRTSTELPSRALPLILKNFPFYSAIKIIPLSLWHQNDKNESKQVPSSSFSHLQSGEVRLMCTNPKHTYIQARLNEIRRAFCLEFIE